MSLHRKHGGVYTKMGQFIASMNHVLPAEYTSTLAELQDRAKFQPYEVIKPSAPDIRQFNDFLGAGDCRSI